MAANILFGMLNIASALILIGVSLPLVRHRIRMNRWYGIRIKKSFESEDNWYKINEYGGRQLIVWSLPMIFAGFVCFFIPVTDSNKDAFSLVLGAFPIALCITVAVARIYAYAKTL